MQARGLKGIPAELVKLLGISHAAASKLINGDTKKFDAINAYVFAEKMQVSLKWLIAEDGPMEEQQKPCTDSKRAEIIRCVLSADEEALDNMLTMLKPKSRP